MRKTNNLYNEVEKQLKKRKPNVETSEQQKRYYRRWYWFSILALLLWTTYATQSTIQLFREHTLTFFDAFYLYLPSIMFFFLGRACLIKTQKSPIQKQVREIWVWENERKHLIYVTVGVTTGVLYGFLIQTERILIIDISLLLSLFSSITIFTSFFAVFLKPKLFLSKFLNTFAFASTIILAVSIPISLVAIPYSLLDYRDSIITKTIDFVMIVFLFGYAVYKIIPYFYIYFTAIKEKRNLTIFQESVIRIMRPEILLHALKSQSQVFEEQSKAIKNVENWSYDKQIAYIRALSVMTDSKPNTFWAVITAILIFIAGSLGDSLVQDILYNQILKPVLCNIFKSLCS